MSPRYFEFIIETEKSKFYRLIDFDNLYQFSVSPSYSGGIVYNAKFRKEVDLDLYANGDLEYNNEIDRQWKELISKYKMYIKGFI